MTSRGIDQALDAYHLDSGITYLDNEPIAHVLPVELYRERYILVASRTIAPPGPMISWTQAATLPLCLLPTEMQNRRILDAKLAEAGAQASPRATANSAVALVSMLRMRSS